MAEKISDKSDKSILDETRVLALSLDQAAIDIFGRT
jgi:hypothetical protein